MYLFTRGWLSDFEPEAAHFAHTFYVLVCALPMVLSSLVMVALLRGEVEKMWSYGEQWWSPAAERKREGIQIGLRVGLGEEMDGGPAVAV